MGVLCAVWTGLGASAVAVEGPAATQPASVDLPAPAPTVVIPERADAVPDDIAGLEMNEQLDGQVDLDLEFVDEAGQPVKLREFFGQRPVILNLGYYRCPMLCGLILNGLTDCLREMEWTPGGEFEVVTLSFDAQETPALAHLKKQNVLKAYGRPEAAGGWHFLTGGQAQIAKLCEAVGYPFRWSSKRGEYAHPSVIVILTPTGQISRYLYGIQFDPSTVRLSLAEATRGRSMATVDRVLLWCFQYDHNEGRYVIAATRIMTVGGLLTVLGLGAWLVPVWVRGSRRKPPAGRTKMESADEHG